MCVSSMIGDHYADKWRQREWFQGVPQMPQYIPVAQISRQEFDDLKREVMDMKALLIRAKEYDARNNEPDCEIDEKMDLLRRVAKLVGVDLGSVIGKPA